MGVALDSCSQPASPPGSPVQPAAAALTRSLVSSSHQSPAGLRSRAAAGRGSGASTQRPPGPARHSRAGNTCTAGGRLAGRGSPLALPRLLGALAAALGDGQVQQQASHEGHGGRGGEEGVEDAVEGVAASVDRAVAVGGGVGGEVVWNGQACSGARPAGGAGGGA